MRSAHPSQCRGFALTFVTSNVAATAARRHGRDVEGSGAHCCSVVRRRRRRSAVSEGTLVVGRFSRPLLMLLSAYRCPRPCLRGSRNACRVSVPRLTSSFRSISDWKMSRASPDVIGATSRRDVFVTRPVLRAMSIAACATSSNSITRPSRESEPSTQSPKFSARPRPRHQPTPLTAYCSCAAASLPVAPLSPASAASNASATTRST